MVKPMRREESSGTGNRRIDQVVERAAVGATDRQIAESLGVSVHTVGTYWKRLRTHWGLSTRAAVVQAHLRHRLERQERALVAELGRRTEAETSLQVAYDELKLIHEVAEKGLTERLVELQRAAVAARRQEKAHALLDEATRAARAMAYDIETALPVVYRGLSPSAEAFGMDVERTLRGETTYYDLIHPDDLHALHIRMAGVRFVPETRYTYLYRVLMPSPRWVMDSQRPVFDAEGGFAGLIGLAVDVHDLVLAGVVAPLFSVTVSRAEPLPEGD